MKPKSKTEVTIEQTKAREDQILDKFLTEMVTTEYEKGKTWVTGFEYKGIVVEAVTKKEQAKTLIEEYFGSNPTLLRKEIVDYCFSTGISERTTASALKEMVDESILDLIKEGQRSSYIWLGNSTKE